MTEVKDALRLDEIPIKVWKCLGDVSICWLTNLFNKILHVN